MKNITTNVNDGILTISIDTKKEQGRSKSGKTIIIASTEGNQQVVVDGETVVMGINIYKYPKA